MNLYTLYEIRIVRDIPMMNRMTSGNYINMIEAEDQLSHGMTPGTEYLIVISK